MSWHYQCFEHNNRLAIHEVYLINNENVYTVEPITAHGETLEELDESLDMMIKDISKYPIRKYEKQPGEKIYSFWHDPNGEKEGARIGILNFTTEKEQDYSFYLIIKNTEGKIINYSPLQMIFVGKNFKDLLLVLNKLKKYIKNKNIVYINEPFKLSIHETLEL